LRGLQWPRADSSDGQSASFTPRRSRVRSLLRPNPLRFRTASTDGPRVASETFVAISGPNLSERGVGGQTSETSRHQVACVAADKLTVPPASSRYIGGVVHRDAVAFRDDRRPPT